MNPAYLEAFIRDPHGTKPGTTMPDVLARLGRGRAGAGRRKALTHFLFSLKKNDFSLQPPDGWRREDGKRLFHSRGARLPFAAR